MARLTLVIGILLILVGAVGYFGTGTGSVTAWIPAFFGVPLVVLGLLARREAARMHAMHAVSLVAMLGVVGSLYRPIKAFAAGEFAFSAAVASQTAMAVLCGTLLAACIKSFVDARLRK